MKARQLLWRFSTLTRIIENRLEYIERMQEVAEKITPTLSNVPHGTGINDKIANAVVEFVDLGEEIKLLLEERSSIERLLEKVGGEEYDILYQIYGNGMTLYTYADERDKSYSTVSKLHRKAIEKLEELL